MIHRCNECRQFSIFRNAVHSLHLILCPLDKNIESFYYLYGKGLGFPEFKGYIY
ncbi:hypothetical protein MmTuc01_2333 [Methanosarcina mazei Tuc01]|uniref:Uncharacterized protein n=1 Tax=Methanosarcina mazei Tuc01 TaxID=1236903 RepID=M1QBP0_METMZ|nr:hypothetical protein MmTuc01_2333 [Methanosarcina mazei Tuc01]